MIALLWAFRARIIALAVFATFLGVVAATSVHIDQCGVHFGLPTGRGEEFPPDYNRSPFTTGTELATLTEAQHQISFTPGVPTSLGQPDRIFITAEEGVPSHSAIGLIYRPPSGQRLLLIESISAFTQASLEHLACWQPGQAGEWSLQDISVGPRALLIKGRASQTLMWLDRGLTFRATTDPSVQKTQLTNIASELRRAAG